MGSEWKQVQLGDLISVKHGYAFKGDDFSETNPVGPVVVTIGNFDYAGGFRFESTRLKRCVSEYPEEYEMQPGEVLLAMTCQTSGGEILGIPGVIPDDGETYLHNQRLGKVILESDEVDLKYLYWLFLSHGFNHHLFTTATGTKILHTAPKRIESYEFHLPPIPEQKAIAHILGTLDDKIELNRRMNATLEGMAQALFKSWFVDFDPVIDNALAAGNPIPDELAPRAEVRRQALTDQKAATTQQGSIDDSTLLDQKGLFPASFQFTEELGWIPEGWETQPLYDIADFVNGAAYKGADFSDAEDALPVIKIAEVKAGITGQTKFTTINKGDKYRVEDGDILLSWSGNPDTSIDTFIWTNGPGYLNQHIFNVRLHDESDRHFVYCQLKYLRSTFAEIARDKQTTGLGHFTAGDMKRLMVFKATDSLLKQFNAAVSSIYSRGYENRLATKTLTKLRDTLLPKLIAGEIRTQESQTATAEAAV